MEQLYKNRLQEYTQKSSIPIPVYKTVNLGTPNAPIFRSTVYVDGTHYDSPKAFSRLKEAEKYVAKIAFEAISQKPKEEAFPFLFKDTSLCKAILNEYAVKMKLAMPIFDTKVVQGLISAFVSNLEFNGVNYAGQRAKSKKDAEQLAARAAILSILDSESKMAMFQIIKSKEKMYAVLHGGVINQKSVGDNVEDGGGNYNGLETSSNKRKESVGLGYYTTMRSVNAAGSSALAQPFHEFKKPKVETSLEVIPYPITFVPPGHIWKEEEVSCSSSGKKKNRKKKKKSQQIVGGDTQKVDSVVPLGQVPSCSVVEVRLPSDEQEQAC